MKSRTVQLDVREDIRNGREPFGRILMTAQQLGPDDRLKLLVPFEPMPLYTFLGNLGFGHTAKEMADGSWEILFARGESSPTPPPSDRTSPDSSREGGERRARANIVKCDVRGLEPPEPMVKILEAVATLPAGAELHAHTDRRPMHLFPQLEARGFRAETSEAPDGGYLTKISHA